MAEDSTTTEPIDLSESVAGEEDPGASIEAPMAPGDEAPAGTLGTAEDICRTCGGGGMLNGGACPECEGTGKINVGIGGA